MKAKRVVFILLIVGAGAAAYFWTSRAPQSITLTGIVTEDAVIVSSQLQGRLSQLLVKEGDQVQRGQLLALIEPQELKADEAYYAHSAEGFTAQVTEAQAALRYQEQQTREQIRQAEATLAATESQLNEAKADLERTRLDAERNAGLFKQGIIAPSVNDQSRTAYDAAKAHVETLQRQIETQRATVALARSNAEQIAVRQSQLQANQHQVAAAAAQTEKAQVRLGYTEIRSPISGIVDVRAALQGEVVNPAQPIVTLVDPDALWVRADVEETYIDRIHLGDRMTVRLPSGAERAGTVYFRGVDAGYATQRDVSRSKRDIKTFEIRLRVDNSDRSLSLGMTAYVLLPLVQKAAPAPVTAERGTAPEPAPEPGR
jgi:HlyD family secretion protein